METIEFYRQCRQCPRKCGVDRTASASLGFCREPADLRIAFAGLHFGEEPLVTVFGGSGTIFFTGCTLRCAFCQNYQISQDGYGRAVDKAEFVDICLKLQSAGAENSQADFKGNPCQTGIFGDSGTGLSDLIPGSRNLVRW